MDKAEHNQKTSAQAAAGEALARQSPGGGLKVCVIGGGSTYTPELVDGLLARRDALPVTEVHLVDPDAERLAVVGGFAQRMTQAAGGEFDVRWGSDFGEALADSTFVVTQLRVGGQAGRHSDEMLGRDFGLVGQETTGVGGFSCAVRTIPVMLELASLIETRAPDATVINFTNPSGLITELLLRHTRLNAIGLCNIPWNMRVEAAEILSAAPDQVQLDLVGLNHLSWVRGATVAGEDRTEELLRGFRSESRVHDEDEPTISEQTIAELRAIPGYYLVYYYETEAMLRYQRAHPTRASQVDEIERRLLARYRDPALVEKPPELMERGGAYYSEAAAALMGDMYRNNGCVHVVDVRNEGALPGLPDDVVVEISAKVNRAGAQAVPAAPLRPDLQELVRKVKDYELMTIAAAVEGDARLARQALLTHPLGPDASQVDALWERLRREHAGRLGRLDG